MTRSQIILLGALMPLVAVMGFLLHELGHWSMGESLGHDMQMSFNSASPIDRSAPMLLNHSSLILAGGPAVTLFLAGASLFVVRASAVLGFALVFFSLHMRIMAYAISTLINPNDEAAIGINLGLGPHLVHLVVIAAIAVLAIFVARKARAGWRSWLVAFVASSASITLVVMVLDPMMGRIL